MIDSKKIFGIVILLILSACSSPTAMIGPVYTLTSSGNMFQASLNYGANQMISKHTGKTPLENLKDLRNIDETQLKNIKKETLESEDFYFLVKNKIEKTRAVLKISN
jgi:hypothetical protein